MNPRNPSRSSSVYSQDTGRERRSGSGVSGATTSSNRPSSRSSNTSGGPHPPGHASLMSSYGHSSYAGSSQASDRSSTGSHGPATPGHASVMSAYGHSSYAGSAPARPPSTATRNTDSLGTFIDSRPQSSSARGPTSSLGRNTDSLGTYIDSRPQTASAQGPPSSARSVARDSQRSSGSAPDSDFDAFIDSLPRDERNAVISAGSASQENRFLAQRNRGGGGGNNNRAP